MSASILCFQLTVISIKDSNNGFKTKNLGANKKDVFKNTYLFE